MRSASHHVILLFALGGCGVHAADTEPDAPTTLATKAPPRTNGLRADFMLRGYFYAGSEQSEGLGGNSESNNMPKPMSALTDVPPLGKELRVLALVDQSRTFAHKYDGFRVVVANASDTPLQFEAQDGRLAIVHEAVDADGKWKAIEYLPSSWCGNSYHTLTLPARNAWEFTAPHYAGDIEARLRIRVVAKDGVVYSNEFLGRIQQAQLSGVQEGHTPTDIMDPYDN